MKSFRISARVRWALVLFFSLVQGEVWSENLPGQNPDLVLESDLHQTRKSHGLPPLTRDVQADRTASDYAADLARRGSLSHRDNRNRRAAERFAWTGRLVTLGEILGAAEDLEALVPAWLDSPGHRKVLLSGEWKSWGIGLARAGEVWVAVVLFLTEGRPTGQSGP